MHPISSVFQSISLADHLTIAPIPEKELQFTCTEELLISDPNNLFVKIFEHFKPVLSGGLSVHLDKIIPIGGGLGGGSSNAALFIEFINTWANLGLSLSEKTAIGSQFGSDIPFFFTGGRAEVTGIGDQVKPCDYPDTPPYFLLIVPNLRLSTPHLYSAFDETYPASTPKPSTELGKNDFWAIVQKRYPLYKSLDLFCRETLNHPLYLSGSGATTYLPASSKEVAETMQAKIQDVLPVKTWIVQPQAVGFEAT